MMPFQTKDLSILFSIQGNLGSRPKDTHMTVWESMSNLTVSSRADEASLATSISQHCGSCTIPALPRLFSWLIFHSSCTHVTVLLGRSSRRAEVCLNPLTRSSSPRMTPVNTQTRRK